MKKFYEEIINVGLVLAKRGLKHNQLLTNQSDFSKTSYY